MLHRHGEIALVAHDRLGEHRVLLALPGGERGRDRLQHRDDFVCLGVLHLKQCRDAASVRLPPPRVVSVKHRDVSANPAYDQRMPEGGRKRGRPAIRTQQEAAREYRRVHGHSALRDAFYGLCCAARWELEARAARWAIDARRRGEGGRPSSPRPSLPPWCLRFIDGYGALGEELFPIAGHDPACLANPIALHAIGHSRQESSTIPGPPADILSEIARDLTDHHEYQARKSVSERLLFEGTAIVAEPWHDPYDSGRPRVDFGSRMALIGAALETDPIGTKRLTLSTRWRKRIDRWHKEWRQGDGPMARAPQLEVGYVEDLVRHLDAVLPVDAVL